MKTYRGNMQSVDPQDALLSLDAFCRKYKAFLCDLLKSHIKADEQDAV